MNHAPLQLHNVTKTFTDGDKEIAVLNSISFQAMKGELVAILGPSGSGKSTFLSIAGLLQGFDRGDMFINGRNVSSLKEQEAADIRLHEMGYVFQASHLVPYLNVHEQLALMLQMANKKVDRARIDDLVEAVGLSHRKTHYAHQLSGGEKQRVAIARAFVNDPSLILADEPTASLDSERSWEIVQLLAKEVKERKKAAIMVTHDETVLPLCDRVYDMMDGHLSLQHRETSVHENK
ncbi:ABC transporter ATP-binding protein [Metabacillus iocasae]|uniref:Putative hemin import ATP-binding protein HrtA n=1 Tax=Priestia iocasae TaxID=2291674 RepID=A0ABS2QVU1_9BACI|nr:ABC transporter ATP-binding protein [Metabacillus iocasae]MBM7703062.1 putative ABC transport system ATP-binding protein [Metabacillus iocasae]